MEKREEFFCFFFGFFLRGESSFLLLQTRAKVEKKEQTFFHSRKKSTQEKSRKVFSETHKRQTDFDREGVASFKKFLHFEKEHTFFHEKEHTKESRVEKSSRTHTDRFCFLRRAAETERAVEKEQFFHLRKSRVFSRESAHKEKSKSLLGNTQTETLTEEKLLLSKKCLHSCRYKYKTIIALFFFSSLRRDALPFALSARALFALRGGVCCCRCF